MEHIKDRILRQEEIDYLVNLILGSTTIKITHIPEKKKYEILNIDSEVLSNRYYKKFCIEYESENHQNYLSRLPFLLRFLYFYCDAISRQRSRIELRDNFFRCFGLDTGGEADDIVCTDGRNIYGDAWDHFGRCYGFNLERQFLKTPKE